MTDWTNRACAAALAVAAALAPAAGALAAAGGDVVVGIVETHGRAETAALTRDLTILPRRSIEYEGRTLTEMDLDALLAQERARGDAAP